MVIQRRYRCSVPAVPKIPSPIPWEQKRLEMGTPICIFIHVLPVYKLESRARGVSDHTTLDIIGLTLSSVTTDKIRVESQLQTGLVTSYLRFGALSLSVPHVINLSAFHQISRSRLCFYCVV